MTEGVVGMSVAPVIVGIDGSESSKQALRWAADYARLSSAPVEALMAWEIPSGYGYLLNIGDVDLEKQARGALEEAVCEVLGDLSWVTLRVEQGHPSVALVEASRDAGLLVVGSHGHGSFAGLLLGSVSQFCVQHAHCPVVVVRGQRSAR